METSKFLDLVVNGAELMKLIFQRPIGTFLFFPSLPAVELQDLQDFCQVFCLPRWLKMGCFELRASSFFWM